MKDFVVVVLAFSYMNNCPVSLIRGNYFACLIYI
nr:MAG TPA: hypothetical protein [Bacteriophage sp.]